MPTHHANKLSGTLHAVARDWSTDGAQERSEAYTPLLDALEEAGVPLGAKVSTTLVSSLLAARNFSAA